MMESECGWNFGEGEIFTLATGLKIEFWILSNRGSSFVQRFDETCDVAHVAVNLELLFHEIEFYLNFCVCTFCVRCVLRVIPPSSHLPSFQEV